MNIFHQERNGVFTKQINFSVIFIVPPILISGVGKHGSAETQDKQGSEKRNAFMIAKRFHRRDLDRVLIPVYRKPKTGSRGFPRLLEFVEQVEL